MNAEIGEIHLTTEDVPPERVITAALAAGLGDVLILGIGLDGEHYAASSTSDPDRLDWMAQTFLQYMRDGVYERGAALVSELQEA